MLTPFFRNLHKLEMIVFRQTLKWKKYFVGTELSCWQVLNVYIIRTSNGFFYAQTNSNIKQVLGPVVQKSDNQLSYPRGRD